MGFFEGFVHPGLLIGTTLAAVPLVIHLLNRQRYKPMPWAAMRFVLAAYKKTRRRAQLENLILLLLRMAAVALLALAIARPFIGERSPLAALAQSRRDVVLVLDASASTGYRADVESTFEALVERAKELVLELDGARDDRVRVVLAGARAKLIAWRRPDEALSVLATLSAPSDEGLDLAAALGEVVRLVEEEAGGAGTTALEIRLLTDLQRRNFAVELPEGGVEGAAPVLTQQLEALAKFGARVRIEDLGPREPLAPNLGIEALELASPLLGPGAACDVAVSVHNFGPTVRAGVRVTLVVDEDQKLPYRPIDVPARGSAKAVFPVVFATSGPHVLTARIEADRLAVDDSRVQVVSVPAAVRVLLVDGEPAPEIENDETGYLAAVLDPPRDDEVLAGSQSAPFEARVIEPHELRDPSIDWSRFDVLVLANVDGLSNDVVEKLERWTASGGALILTMGKRVDAQNLNARLFRPDGSGLLPAELGGRVALPRRAGYHRVRDFALDHAAFAFFTDERWRPLLTEVPIYEFALSRPSSNARVLAHLDDDLASPLLIEKSYDRGKVFLWTTSIDPEWTRLPESPRTLVPLVHEWLRYAARPSTTPRNVAVGGALVVEVESFPRNPSVLDPQGGRRPLESEPEPLGPSAWRVTALGSSERAGLYRIEFEGAESEPLAAQFDAREGDLERLGAGEIAALHPVFELQDDGARSSGDEREQPEPAKGELWRGIAIACFVALVAETLWAAWLGRRRSRA
ncbi:MAG: BatA domain-containing protein [Planctomycetes bacterium]|nr:BatA domain-containing protein [Planctomycetota bacterium]